MNQRYEGVGSEQPETVPQKATAVESVTNLEVFREVICEEEAVPDYQNDMIAVISDVLPAMNSEGYELVVVQIGSSGRWEAGFRQSSQEVALWEFGASMPAAISNAAVRAMRDHRANNSSRNAER